jgi:hypothetical protein
MMSDQLPEPATRSRPDGEEKVARGEGPGWGETGSTLPADQFCSMQCTITPTLDSDLPTPHLGPSPQAALPVSDPPAAAETPVADEIDKLIVVDGLLRRAGVERAFRGLDGRYFAAVLVGGRLECDPVDSDDFRRRLIRSYDDATGRALSPALVETVVETLRARAGSEDDTTRVVVKRTRRETWPAYVVHVGSGRRRAAEIHRRGRTLGDRPGFAFWRQPWRGAASDRSRGSDRPARPK